MKKFVSLILAAVLLVAACSVNTLAAVPETVEPRASEYLNAYSATLTTGTKKGEVVLTFYVSSGRTDITKIGINNIVVYRSNGTRVRSIGGTYENGLLKANVGSYGGSYSVILTTNTSYYMEVTFVAGNSSGVDTRTFTTGTAYSHS